MEALKVDIKLRLQNETRSIRFETASRIALIGPSGCGKSSLVKSLAGISDLGQGHFYYQGQDLMKLPPWERKIGYVPQDLILMPHLSVKENLLFPVSARPDRELYEGLHVAHLLERMPRNLSGGEKQRVALARALSSASGILIMDEPFSSLDFSTKEKIVSFVDHYTSKRGLSLIFISHEEKEISLLKCDRFNWESLT